MHGARDEYAGRLAYGTDQGRFLQAQLKEAGGNESNPYRAMPAWQPAAAAPPALQQPHAAMCVAASPALPQPVEVQAWPHAPAPQPPTGQSPAQPALSSTPTPQACKPAAFNPGSCGGRQPVRSSPAVLAPKPAQPAAAAVPSPASGLYSPAAPAVPTPHAPPMCNVAPPKPVLAVPAVPAAAAAAPQCYVAAAAAQPQPSYTYQPPAAPLPPVNPSAATAPDPPATLAGAPPVVPGEAQTLAYGTDQGRWLEAQLRANGNGATGSSNPYRMQRQHY